MTAAENLTQLLRSLPADGGDPAVADRLYRAIHHELRDLAAGLMRKERPGHTLQPTALVHEAFLRLVDASRIDFQNRAHFFGIASRAMRQVLIDHARARDAAKRGGDWQRVTLDDRIDALDDSGIDLFELNDALDRLAVEDEQMARIVELRFFGGLTEQEIAKVLGISRRSVQREWWVAKLWLKRRLAEPKADTDRS
jgi:RNA polymerase sigma factor (TIGR02999 family)